jgi:integrase
MITATWGYFFVALTDTEIRKAKPRAAAYKFADGGGLYLFIKPEGSKLWRWKYRFAGKEKLMALGKYPDVTLAQARQKHLDARRLLASGVDPMLERKSAKLKLAASHENSFETIATRWFRHWQENKSPRHAGYVWRRMEANVLPRLGSSPISEIAAPEIVAMVKAVDERGAGDIAKRVLETTGQVFRYAIAHGHARHNPAGEIRPGDLLRSRSKSNFARIGARELPALLREIEIYRGSQITRLAMKLMALTFLRTSELIGARWEEFDWKAARWDIPADRMKMRTPHIVPLARQTIQILELLRQLTGRYSWLFPGDRNTEKSMSNNTILKALERMGYGGRMTGHGFRGLASTILHEKGYAHEHIEIQLAHAPRNAVSAAYNHALYLKQRAEMMQDWANFLDESLRGASIDMGIDSQPKQIEGRVNAVDSTWS